MELTGDPDPRAVLKDRGAVRARSEHPWIYRLLHHAEADGVPGYVVDRHGASPVLARGREVPFAPLLFFTVVYIVKVGGGKMGACRGRERGAFPLCVGQRTGRTRLARCGDGAKKYELGDAPGNSYR